VEHGAGGWLSFVHFIAYNTFIYSYLGQLERS
jgi:hypothetical protein